MKKSLIALLLTLALVLTVSVFAVSAEETETPVYASDLTVDGDTATGYCPHCEQDVTWTKWNGTSHRRTNDTNGNGNQQHLFLGADVTASTAFLLADKANTFIVLHLNGKTLTHTRTSGDGILQPNNANSTVAVLTNTAGEGGITSTAGNPLNGNVAGTVVIYGGNFSTTRTGVNGGIFDTSASGAGGKVGSNPRITIYGGNFIQPEEYAATNGGLFYVNAGTLTINGGTFTGTASTIGGAVYATGSTATVTVNGGTFTGCSAPNGGAFYVQDNGTINLNGGEISGCFTTTANGGAIYKAGSGKLNINGTTISACIAGKDNTGGYGGAIYVAGAGVAKMTSGMIKDCYATNRAGAISIASGSNFTIEGGTIQNCYLASNAAQPFGGNIYNEGTLTITGGTITKGNVPADKSVTAKSGAYGANICNRGGSTNISGANTVISNGSGATYGGNLYLDRGTHTIVDATISGGVAGSNGGNFYIGENASTATNVTMKNVTISGGQAHRGAAIYNVSAVSTVNVEGCTIQDGKAGLYGSVCVNNGTVNIWNTVISGGKPANSTVSVSGGNVYVAAGTLNIGNDATKTNPAQHTTISGGNAKNGGNIYFAGGTLAIDGAEITGGKATEFGGNVYLAAAGATIENCEILSGVAGTKLVDEETGNMLQPTSNGRGGNLAILAAADITNCVIRNGEAYAYNPCGGNIYLQGTIGTDKQVTLDGCTITGGFGYYSGGNIQHHASGTVVITGDSYIAEGKAGTMGGNIQLGVQTAAVLKVEGNTEINSKNSSAGGNNGVNIHVASSQHLYLGGNARIVSPATQHSIAVAGAGTVHLSGNVYMNSYLALYAAGHNVDTTKVYATGRVVAEEGFTGDVLLLTYYKSATGTNTGTYDTVENWAVGGNTVNFGAEAPAYLQAGENYANTGTIKVHSKGRSGYVTVWDGAKFTIAPYTAFVSMNNGIDGSDLSSHVEHGLADLTTLPEDTGYVKLYNGGELALNAGLDGMPIDLNNQIVTINTNGYTLAPIDYRTDNAVTSKSKLTVTGDESKVQLLVKNPVTNYQYLNVKGTDGTWTSNRIRVEMTKVSIKTTKDGIYYTTKVNTNDNAKAVLEDFGTAVTVAPETEIGSNFMEVAETQGILYTCMPYDKEATESQEARSALITGILAEGEDNNARCDIKIKATSYVTAVIEGLGDVVIMADEASELSMKEIMIKLDDKVEELNRLKPEGYEATTATAVGFYNKWADPFAAWDCLPNLKKAADAAVAA